MAPTLLIHYYSPNHVAFMNLPAGYCMVDIDIERDHRCLGRFVYLLDASFGFRTLQIHSYILFSGRPTPTKHQTQWDEASSRCQFILPSNALSSRWLLIHIVSWTSVALIIQCLSYYWMCTNFARRYAGYSSHQSPTITINITIKEDRN